MPIAEVTLRRIRVPLREPYNLAIGVVDALDSIVGEIRDEDGRAGFFESTILPGYTPETGDGAWRFCREHGERMIGCDIASAKGILNAHRGSDPHAVSVLQVALEMLEGNPLLAAPDREVRIPLLAPVNSKNLDDIPDEIEALLARGFETLKVKVGWDVDSDLARLELIQRVNGGRAALRIDANQGFDRAQALRFAEALDPESLQLFEQPCAEDDWESNAAVASASPVSVMMDESVYGFAEIERAATMKGCGFVKLKISKMTGVDLLAQGLKRIRELGLEPILGNGVATDIGCWVEACVARDTISQAGEMHGFLKNTEQLMTTPLPFEDGAIVLRPGFQPALDYRALERLTVELERFA